MARSVSRKQIREEIEACKALFDGENRHGFVVLRLLRRLTGADMARPIYDENNPNASHARAAKMQVYLELVKLAQPSQELIQLIRESE